MSKHTPGPWVAFGNEVHDRAAQYDASGARVGETPNCICVVEYPRGETDVRHGATKEANARLIAAAPDLLEACKALLADVKDLSCECMADSCGMAEARAAVAKAEGANHG